MERAFSSAGRICRLCMGTMGYFVNVFDSNLAMDNTPASLATKITRCAAIEVEEGDGLPDSVCHRCVAKVESAYEFRLLCETSYDKLRRLLLTKVSEKANGKTMLVCETSEQTNPLQSKLSSKEGITCLYMSSNHVDMLSKTTTDMSNSNDTALACKNRKPNDRMSKSLYYAEFAVNRRADQENAVKHILVLQGTSEQMKECISNLKVCILSEQCNKCLRSVENCDQGSTQKENVSGDRQSTSTLNRHVKINLVSDQPDNECYKNSSCLNVVDTFKYMLKTMPLLPQECATTSVKTYEHALQHSACRNSEALPEDSKLNISTTLASEVTASNSNKDAYQKQNKATNPLSISNKFSMKGNTKRENSGMYFEPPLSSSVPCNISKDDNRPTPDAHFNQELPLQKENAAGTVDEIKIPVKVRRQSRHTSTENAAVALIMLKTGIDNNVPLSYNNQEQATSLTNEEKPTEHSENITETNRLEISDMPSVNALPLTSTERDVINSVDKRVKRKSVIESAASYLGNEKVNIKTNYSTGTSSVDKINNKFVNVTDTTWSCDPILDIKETAENLDTKNKESVKPPANTPNKQLELKNSIHSEEKSNTPKLNRGSELVHLEKFTESQSLHVDEHITTVCNSSELTEKTTFLENDDGSPEEQLVSIRRASVKLRTVHLAEDSSKNMPPTTNKGTSAQAKNLNNIIREVPDCQNLITAPYDCHMLDQNKVAGNNNEGKGINTKLSTYSHQMVNNYSRKSTCSNSRENVEKMAENAKYDLCLNNTIESTTANGRFGKCGDGKRYCVNYEKKNRKCDNRAHNTTLISHQLLAPKREDNRIEHELSKKQIEDTNIKQLSSMDEDKRMVCSEQALFPESILNDTPCETESHAFHDDDSLSGNSIKGRWEKEHPSVSISPEHPKAFIAESKTELPLKELRVVLVRLKSDCYGHYLNSSKKLINDSFKSTEGRLQKRAADSSSCVRKLCSSQCSSVTAPKLMRMDDFNLSSVTENDRKSRALRTKRAKRTVKKVTKHQERSNMSSISTINNVPFSSIPSSCQINISYSKPMKYKIPKLSPRTVNESLEECKYTRRGNCHKETLEANKECRDVAENLTNTTANCDQAPILRFVDGEEQIEKVTQQLLKPPEDSPVTSLDSMEITQKSHVEHYISSSLDNKKPNIEANNYQKSSNNSIVDFVNKCHRKYTVPSDKYTKASNTNNVVQNINDSANNIRLKMCDETMIVKNTGAVCTPETNKNKKIDVRRKLFCRSRRASTMYNKPSTRKVNVNGDNITSPQHSTSGKRFRTSRSLDIEGYRKLRQSKASHSSRINAPHNNNCEIGVASTCTTCIDVKVSSSKDMTIGRQYSTDDVTKNDISVSHCADACNRIPVLHLRRCEKGPWSCSQNFLHSCYLTSKEKATISDEKAKRPRNLRQLFQREQSVKSHRSLEYKQKLGKCNSTTNILNFTKSLHSHDEQCKIIRKEILKSAYMFPRLAVLTADSPEPSPLYWFEEKHPETEPTLPADVTSSCKTLSHDLVTDKYVEKEASTDSFNKNECQVSYHLSKKENVQNNDGIIVDLKKWATTEITNLPTNKNMNEELEQIRSKKNDEINKQIPNKISTKVAKEKKLYSPLSCKNGKVLDRRNVELNCAVLQNSVVKSRETENQTHLRLVNDQLTVHRKMHCNNNIVEATRHTVSETEGNITEKEHFSENLDNPRIPDYYKTRTEGSDSSFGTSKTLQDVEKTVAFFGNSHETRYKLINESHESQVKETPNHNSKVTDEQTDVSFIDKAQGLADVPTYTANMLIVGSLQQEQSDILLNKEIGDQNIVQVAQENNKIDNFSSSSFSVTKEQTVPSKIMEVTYLDKGQPSVPTDKEAVGRNSAGYETFSKTLPYSNTDLSVVTETISNCEFPNNSEDSDRTPSNQIASVSIPSSNIPRKPLFTIRFQDETNDKNNENQAPKRVCYTSNFIRKDLSSRDMVSKNDFKESAQPRGLYTFNKIVRSGRRAKSLDTFSNNKLESKLRMNPLYRTSEATYIKAQDTKTVICKTLKEASNHRGENDKVHQCKGKLDKEQAPLSTINVAKMQFENNNNINRSHCSEMHYDEPSAKFSLTGSKETLSKANFNFDKFCNDGKTRTLENKMEINVCSLANAGSLCSDFKSIGGIISHRDEIGSWLPSKDMCGESDPNIPPKMFSKYSEEQIMGIQKPNINVEKPVYPSTGLHKNETECNVFVCDNGSKRFTSLDLLKAHKQIHEIPRKRPYTSIIHNNPNAVREYSRPHEGLCNRTKRWRVALDYSGCFKQWNIRKSFYRQFAKTGFRNRGNGMITVSRMNGEPLAEKAGRNCKVCGQMFTSDFQFSQHFKKGCR